ncbi:MAG: hypothetical protein JXA14_06930 [Anaerolineae bacterium]|nr:hypothetical protein [Anaerolineae bacterium]
MLGQYMLAALLISNLAALLSCFLLYQESLRLFGKATAQRTIAYFLGFPTAFFLVGAYTESVFILLVLLCWRAAIGEKWGWAGLWGSLAVVTRFHGLALFVPLAYLWWRSKPRGIWGLALLAIPFAFLAWLLYVRFGLNGGFPWEVQGRFWDERVGWPWEGLANNALALLGLHSYGDLPPFPVLLDLFLGGMFVVLTLGSLRGLPKEHALLMAGLLFICLIRVNNVGLLRSMSRYVLPLFPGFVLLARVGRRSWFHWPWVCVSFAFQALASALFFRWYWVA